MRPVAWMMVMIAATSTTACSWTSEGGITGRIESTDESTVNSAEGSWDGAPISLSNTHGSAQIVGVPGKTNISVHARFVAGANSQEDADAAFADIAAAITIEERDGAWFIDCPQAKEWHGSVDPASTGCTSLRVEVPAGSAAAPLELTGGVDNGGIHVSGVTVKKLTLTAPFGLVADVTPAQDAEIHLWGNDLASGLCSSVLRLPAESTFENAQLTVSNPSVEYLDAPADDPTFWLGTYVEGFSDAPAIPPRTGSFLWTRGIIPFSVSVIEVHASLGKAILTTAPVPAYEPFNECYKMEVKVSL